MRRTVIFKTFGAVAAVGAIATAVLAPRQAPAKEPGSFQRPLTFEPNLGQTDPSVSFLARGGYALWLAGDSATLGLPGQKGAIRMKWLRGNTRAEAKGIDPVASVGNYFLGSDESKWRTKVPNFARVRLEEIYPGVGLVFHPSSDRKLEYDFEVAPGADASRIALGFEGAKKLAVEPNGDLRIETPAGDVIQRKPVAFQSAAASRREVAAGYEIRDGEVRIKLGEYDPSRPLTIDPVFEWARFYGGSDTDQPNDMAVDASGNTYITGQTYSSNLPIVSTTYQTTSGGSMDAFVAKFNLAGTHLYTTYLGGQSSDWGTKIAVDGAENVYLVVESQSSTFPAVACGLGLGTSDSRRVKLINAGAALQYSCKASGPLQDVEVTSGGTAYWLRIGNNISHCVQKGDPPNSANLACFPTSKRLWAIALSAGSVWVTGAGMDTQENYNKTQVYVAKIGLAISGYGWCENCVVSTDWGGSKYDAGFDIAVDSNGTAFVTGDTESTDLPNAANSYGGGPKDAFVASFAPGGIGLAARYLGGPGSDRARSIAVRQAGSTTQVYVAGMASPPLPSSTLGFGSTCSAPPNF